MTVLNATEARSKLYTLIDETMETHQPILITGKRGNAVLISEDDWNAISETLHLLPALCSWHERVNQRWNEGRPGRIF